MCSTPDCRVSLPCPGTDLRPHVQVCPWSSLCCGVDVGVQVLAGPPAGHGC